MTCQHEHRIRYAGGFWCEDCYGYWDRGGPTYNRHQLPDDLREIIARVVWQHHKAGLGIPMDSYLLATALVCVSDDECRERRERVLNEGFRFLCRHGLSLDTELAI